MGVFKNAICRVTCAGLCLAGATPAAVPADPSPRQGDAVVAAAPKPPEDPRHWLARNLSDTGARGIDLPPRVASPLPPKRDAVASVPRRPWLPPAVTPPLRARPDRRTAASASAPPSTCRRWRRNPTPSPRPRSCSRRPPRRGTRRPTRPRCRSPRWPAGATSTAPPCRTTRPPKPPARRPWPSPPAAREAGPPAVPENPQPRRPPARGGRQHHPAGRGLSRPLPRHAGQAGAVAEEVVK